MRWRFHCLLPGLVPLGAIAQITVGSGTQLRIATGTQVEVAAPIAWQVPAGAVVVNDGLIQLHAGATVIEAEGSSITGEGTERITQEHAAPLVGVEPGGLGLGFTTTEAPGTLTIVRGHTTLVDPLDGPSIARWFEASADGPLAASVALRYDPSELNGLTPQDLLLFRAENTAGPWSGLPTAYAGPPNTLQAQMDLGVITAFDGSLHVGLPTIEAPAPPSLYPNPAIGPVTLVAAAHELVERVELFGPDGRLYATVGTAPFRSGPLPIALEGLAAGRYTLRINAVHHLPLVIP